jgi:hypothetical protein
VLTRANVDHGGRSQGWLSQSSGLTGRRHTSDRGWRSLPPRAPAANRRDPTQCRRRASIRARETIAHLNNRIHAAIRASPRTRDPHAPPRRLRPDRGGLGRLIGMSARNAPFDVSLRLDRLALDEGGCVGPSRTSGCSLARAIDHSRARSAIGGGSLRARKGVMPSAVSIEPAVSARR